MLSIEQINKLNDKKEYKKTRGLKYNWKFSKSVRSSKDFSISIDISLDGVPWQYLNMASKVLIWIIKGFIISEEIGRFRNDLVDRLLDSSIHDDFDICSLITPDYRWVSASAHKLKQLKSFVIAFISDRKIQMMIYDVLEYTEAHRTNREELINSAIHKIESLFSNKIALLLKERVISTRHEFEEFFENNHDTLTQQQSRSQISGNLFTVDRTEMGGGNVNE